MKKCLLLIVGLAVLVPGAARAQLNVGARTGYSFALGDADGTAAMTDITSGQLPLHLDIGYRPSGTGITIGGYLTYGFGSTSGLTKDTCAANGVSCSTNSLHVGAQLLYDLGRPHDPTVPWLGFGLGYDALTFKAAAGTSSSEVTMSGVEFIFQGGYDWRVGAGAIGGFASFSLARYTDLSGGGQSGALADTRLHEWLTLGLRGSFDLGG